MVTTIVGQRRRGGWWEEVYQTAHEYDIPWEAGRPSPELVALVEEGLVRPGQALDLGCGLGTNAIYLAQKGFWVAALDIAPSAVQRARKRAQGVDVRFLEGDARGLPFQDHSFDFVYDRGCLHHLEGQGPLEYEREVGRVLRKGGRYQLLAFTSRFRRVELENLFQAGFHIIRFQEAHFLERGGTLRSFHSVLMERR